MAVIRKRSRLKASSFAVVRGSGKSKVRKYPITDAAHARNALARVSANGTRAEKRAVARKVRSRFPGIYKRSSVAKRWAR